MCVTATDVGFTQFSELNPNVSRGALYLLMRIMKVSVRVISGQKGQAVTRLVGCDNSGDGQVSIFHDASRSLPFRRGDVVEVKLAKASICPRDNRYNSTLADHEVLFKNKHVDSLLLKTGDYPWLPVHRYKCAAQRPRRRAGSGARF